MTNSIVPGMKTSHVLRILGLALLTALAGLGLTTAALAASTDNSEPPGGCYVPQGGPPHTADGKPCTPPPPSPQMQKIEQLEAHLGELLLGEQAGTASHAEVETANTALSEARGEATPEPIGSPDRIAKGIQDKLGIPLDKQNQYSTSSADVQRAIEQYNAAQGEALGVQPDIPPGVFFPFTQINGNYCGPASAESVLYYLFGGEYRIASGYDPNFYGPPWNGHPNLIGDAPPPPGLAYSGPAWDQGILADSTWLNTAANGSTGFYAMFDTLDNWMGTNALYGYHYVWTNGEPQGSFSTQIFDEMTASIAAGYPVVENPLYLYGETYLPDGFLSQSTYYYHFDVVYGTYVSNWLRHVQIGQVYGEPYVLGPDGNYHPNVTAPYQDYLWDFGGNNGGSDQYVALEDNNGIILQ